MSSLVVQRLAALVRPRAKSLVAIAPVSPGGMRLPAEVVGFLAQMAASDDMRSRSLAQQWGTRLSERWLEWKLARWRDSATTEAVAGYARMFGTTDLTPVIGKSDLPVLALAGEHDQPPFLEPALRAGFGACYGKLEVQTIANAGHYPMQETPVDLASRVERFLDQNR
jgi:pimeloyl-ACP methyl ester carboxylesterase